MITLCAPAIADGNYPSAAGVSTGLRDLCVIMQGSFGGGTVTLQVSHDGSVWVAVANGALTAAGTLRLQLGADMLLRAVITGSTTPSITVKAS